MASSKLNWTNPSEAYTEDVLKCIKETLKKEDYLSNNAMKQIIFKKIRLTL